jgi:hypothetical protein
MDRWSLPGPAGFIDSLLQELRDGTNVIVGAPTNVATALQPVLESRLVDCGWRLTGPFMPSDGQPIDVLYMELDMQATRPAGRSIASLMIDIEKSKRGKSIVIVTILDDRHWSSWLRFIEEYANASRALPAIERTQFLLMASGIPKNKLTINKAPALQCFIWDGHVGEADVFSYVHQSLRQTQKKIDPRFSKLIARIVTRLALWDFDLADRLLRLDWRDLFDPMQALLTVDVPDEGRTVTDTNWEKGGSAEFDGERMIHAFVLSRSSDPKKELAMRLWAAQAAELLPVLEVKRRQLVERMKSTRKLPLSLTLNDEPVRDLNDLEIGDLFYLAKKHRLPTNIVSMAEKFRKIRNKLAHLEPVGIEEAFNLLARGV